MKDNSFILPDFDISMLNELVDSNNTHYYAKNSIILDVGEIISDFFFVLEGKIKFVFKNDKGSELIFSFLRKNNIFGEEFIHTGVKQESLFSLIASEDCEIIKIPLVKLEKYSQKHPKLYIAYSKSINAKMCVVYGQFYAIALNNSMDNISNILYKTAFTFGTKNAGNIELPYNFTHQMISEMTNCTRGTVTCMFAKLKNQGVIEFKKNQLIVKDMNRLKENTNFY